MCTLTYLPTGKDSFIWTQNRDESPLRTSLGLAHSKDETLIYPKEPLSGGTWIGISTKNRVISLLNGAFVQNKYVPSTKRSRGLVVLDFLDCEDVLALSKDYDFEDIEPFTMIVYEKGQLFDIRWDKTKLHVQILDASKPYIWSSSTLYPAEIKAKRKEWFAAYLKAHPNHTKASVLEFHQHAGTGDPKNDLIMDRGIVRTVSMTNIIKKEAFLNLDYYDLINGGSSSASLTV